MTLDDLAALHARCLAVPRPWTAPEFAEVLGTAGAFLLPRANAFLLGRVVADEAELLTLAVAPEARRQGLARALCHGFAAASRARGAATAFLEVAADNAPARALYLSTGWVEAGRRRAYYDATTDAIVMRLGL